MQCGIRCFNWLLDLFYSTITNTLQYRIGLDMLTGIKIEKLFDIFDYDIEFKKEGITILTGPNGYGKTTVLKILDALASQNSLFFTNLLFQKIIFNLSYNNKVTLEKKNND